MNIQKIQRIIELVFGLFLLFISGVPIFNFIIERDIFYFYTSLILMISGVPLGLYCFIGHDTILELRTANLHEMTSEGVIHSKDKSLYININENSVKSVKSVNGYLVRVRTPIGFYDVYSQDAYMTYKEGDDVKILVKTRYNRKGKAFEQETTILGLLAPKYK